jgi:hypothetical protein
MRPGFSSEGAKVGSTPADYASVVNKLHLVVQLRNHAKLLRMRASETGDQRMQDALLKTANTCESRALMLECNYRTKLQVGSDIDAPLDLEV